MTTAEEALARSVIDQHLAAAGDAEHLWPHNEFMMLCDLKLGRKVLDVAVGPDTTYAWTERDTPTPVGKVVLVWAANGAVIPVLPDEPVDRLAGATFPLVPGVRASCDRCERAAIPYGALLFAHGSKVIGLLICADCAQLLDLAGLQPVWTFRPTKTPQEGDSQ